MNVNNLLSGYSILSRFVDIRNRERRYFTTAWSYQFAIQIQMQLHAKAQRTSPDVDLLLK